MWKSLDLMARRGFDIAQALAIGQLCKGPGNGRQRNDLTL